MHRPRPSPTPSSRRRTALLALLLLATAVQPLLLAAAQAPDPCDANGDGQLSPEEAACDDAPANDAGSQEPGAEPAPCDANGDGVVDDEEGLSCDGSPGSADPCDANADGKVDEAEAAACQGQDPAGADGGKGSDAGPGADAGKGTDPGQGGGAGAGFDTACDLNADGTLGKDEAAACPAKGAAPPAPADGGKGSGAQGDPGKADGGKGQGSPAAPAGCADPKLDAAGRAKLGCPAAGGKDPASDATPDLPLDPAGSLQAPAQGLLPPLPLLAAPFAPAFLFVPSFQLPPLQVGDLLAAGAQPVGDPAPRLGGLLGEGALLEALGCGGNWDFECGLAGWTPSGRTWADEAARIPDLRNAFAGQPVLGDNVVARRVLSLPVGGDYWADTLHPVGHQGQRWVGTYEYRPSAEVAPGTVRGDAAQGTLTSSVFRVERPFLAFRVGGGSLDDGVRVELQIARADHQRILAATALLREGLEICRNVECPRARGVLVVPEDPELDGDWAIVRRGAGERSELLSHVVWDLAGMEGSQARIRIVDASVGTWGHINVDDFRFLAAHPFRGVGGPRYPVTDRPVWGWADLHAHPASHLGFGGALFSGLPEGPIPEALSEARDLANHGPAHVGSFGNVSNLFVVGLEGDTRPNGGYPTWEGWPKFDSRIHQQMHVDWVRRAYEGGQRLMVALVITNSLLSHEFGGDNDDVPDDDANVTDRQLDYIAAMVGRNSGWMGIARSPAEARELIGQGKMAVVLGIEADSLGNCKTPAHCPTREHVARYVQHIHDRGVRYVFPIHFTDNAFGGTAILGSKFNVLNLFETRAYQVPESGAEERVDFRLGDDEDIVIRWYRANVSGATRGAAAGAAAAATVAAGACAPLFLIPYLGALLYGGCVGISALVGAAVGAAQGSTEGPGWYHPEGAGLPYKTMLTEPSPGGGEPRKLGMVNSKGLTPQGRWLLEELAARRMIIDTDHMSQKSLEETLAWAEARGYSALVAGHTAFRDLQFRRYGDDTLRAASPEHLTTEYARTADHVARLTALGGMVGIGLHNTDIPAPDTGPGAKLGAYCADSSKTLAQQYLYAVRAAPGKGVALGSDLNGMPGSVGPRFGPSACAGLADDDLRKGLQRGHILGQRHGVQYATPLTDWWSHRFPVHGEHGLTAAEAAAWQGVAIHKSGVPLGEVRARADKLLPNALAIAEGLRCPQGHAPAPSGSDEDRYRVAACVLRHNEDTGLRGRVGQETFQGPQEHYHVVTRAWDQWRWAEESPGHPPLTRYTVPRGDGTRKDFDVNLDGVPMYGLLPDLLQDLRNVGLTGQELTPMMSSAEQLLRTWEGA